MTTTVPDPVVVSPSPTAPSPAPSAAAVRGGGGWNRLWRGRPDDAAWVRPALLTLLGLTGVLYLWGLGASGWANSFYSAAVQAGSTSWKAFFFGSFDSSNLITVDKPPASLWVMDLSARLFGVNAWSILVPQALIGVATVGVVYATVRRWFGPSAGLIAGAVTALTPVAVLMFRFNNPDALLVLLLTLGAWATTRAVERGSTRWLVLAGVFVGFGFLAKSLQAFLVVPAFALTYLVAAPVALRRRLVDLLAAGTAVLVSAGWWVAIVQLWPAGSRPYIGGSQDNSELGLIFGYNGFGRLTGNETGSVTGGGGAGPGGGSMWGPTGIGRLFTSDFGGQVSWLLPAALVLLVAIGWLSLRATRTDRLRAAGLLWGGMLLVTAAVISLSKGIIHPYYTVALAPSIGALVGIGAVELWRRRESLAARAALTATLLLAAGTAFVLLRRSSSWIPALPGLVLGGAVALSIGLVLLPWLPRRLAVVAAVTGMAIALAGPAAYALQTASTTHSGSLPSAGPAVSGSVGPGGGRRFAGNGQRGFPGAQGPGFGFGQGQGFPGGQGFQGLPRARAGQGFQGRQGLQGGGGAAGGLLQGSEPSATVVRALLQGSSSSTWIAAAVGANTAAGYQLATDRPVMALGGFNGSDPAPTLEQFQAYVAAGQVHWFIASGGIGGGGLRANGGSQATSEITQWVEQNFTATTVDGITLYDLSAG